MNVLTKLAIASVFALAVSPAIGHGSNGDSMNMMGMHDMSATVIALDSTTGIVDVNSGGVMLKVHFPPATLSSVKAGDKITLHLGFTKP